MSRSLYCVSIVSDQVTLWRTTNARHVLYATFDGKNHRFFHCDLSRKEATASVSDATRAVVTNITWNGLTLVQINLTNRDLNINLLAMCDLGFSISSLDKSVVPEFQHQGRKLISSRDPCSPDVKTEIMPIAVSAHKRSRLLSAVQFCVQKKLKLGDQFLELQEFRDHYEVLAQS